VRTPLLIGGHYGAEDSVRCTVWLAQRAREVMFRALPFWTGRRLNRRQADESIEVAPVGG